MDMRITTTELWNLLRDEGKKFFSVEFERRTNSRDGLRHAGDIRTMLCRTGMSKYKKGLIADATRDEHDFRHGILTVWSMDAYTANLRRGMSKETAAFASWRCIDITTVHKCSLLNGFDIDYTDLPPDIVIGHHNIVNEYRLANLPRTPLAV